MSDVRSSPQRPVSEGPLTRAARAEARRRACTDGAASAPRSWAASSSRSSSSGRRRSSAATKAVGTAARRRRPTPAPPAPASRSDARRRREGLGRDQDLHHRGAVGEDRARPEAGPALRRLGRPGHVGAALEQQGRRPAHVPRQPHPLLLRPRAGAEEAEGALGVPERRLHVRELTGRGSGQGLVRHRLDRPAQRLGEGRQDVGGVRRLRQGGPLPRRRHREAAPPGLPGRRHHQGLGDRRPRRVPAALHRQPRRLLPRGGPRSRRPARAAVEDVVGRVEAAHLEQRLGRLGARHRRLPLRGRRELVLPHREAQPRQGRRRQGHGRARARVPGRRLRRRAAERPRPTRTSRSRTRSPSPGTRCTSATPAA